MPDAIIDTGDQLMNETAMNTDLRSLWSSGDRQALMK